jgi:hypothetical protein
MNRFVWFRRVCYNRIWLHFKDFKRAEYFYFMSRNLKYTNGYPGSVMLFELDMQYVDGIIKDKIANCRVFR